MDSSTKKKLIDYLSQHITENKRDKIQNTIFNRTKHVTLVLEDVFNAHNAGAVIRSADCFGVHDVHVVELKNIFSVSTVAHGAAKWANIVRHKNTESCFQQLKQQGYRIVATTPHTDACYLPDLPIDNKLALIFGTEELGLSQYSLEYADEHVKIPMYGFTESFNVSVSAALCMYDVTTRLRASTVDWQLSEEEILDVKLQWLRALLRGAGEYEKKFFEKN